MGQQDDSVALKEAQTRAAVMQASPTLFVFERNVDKIVGALPEMWRYRKFGH